MQFSQRRLTIGGLYHSAEEDFSSQEKCIPFIFLSIGIESHLRHITVCATVCKNTLNKCVIYRGFYRVAFQLLGQVKILPRIIQHVHVLDLHLIAYMTVGQNLQLHKHMKVTVIAFPSTIFSFSRQKMAKLPFSSMANCEYELQKPPHAEEKMQPRCPWLLLAVMFFFFYYYSKRPVRLHYPILQQYFADNK